MPPRAQQFRRHQVSVLPIYMTQSTEDVGKKFLCEGKFVLAGANLHVHREDLAEPRYGLLVRTTT